MIVYFIWVQTKVKQHMYLSFQMSFCPILGQNGVCSVPDADIHDNAMGPCQIGQIESC